MLTQNLIDLLAAVFVFLLFAAIYRKRRTAAVGYWMAAWLFVVLHFGALAWTVRTPGGEAAQGLLAVGTLIFCAIAFVLSREEAHGTRARRVSVWCALGVPWMSVVLCASLPRPWFAGMVVCTYAASAAMLALVLQYFRARRVQAVCAIAVIAGCTVWLSAALPTHDAGLVLGIVLTQCFGLNAVLLSFGRPRLSAGTVATSVGAIAWGAVWACGSALEHFAPAAVVSPELWNLPKYMVAAGMLLTLLEEEIRAAAAASEQYRMLFAGNPHPMWMYDPETLRFLQMNDAAVAQYGFTAEDLRGATVLDVFAEEDRTPDLREKLEQAQQQQLSGPWTHRSRHGATFQVDIASQPVVQGGRRAIFAMMHDVTDRQKLHAQLMRQAHHDVLTDLPNRALFERRLERAIVEARQNGRKVALFCIDLDRFKQINDSYGHAAGDLCLKEAAARITRRVGDRGTLARSGGDEFMLYLSDLETPEEADVCGAALLRDLRHPVQMGAFDLELAASVGFALFPDDGQETGQLWRDADAAMYQAKRAGGAQCVRVSSEISDSANQANEIELGLRRALKTGNIEVHYQPQMTVDGRLHGFEALFRSSDPLLEPVSPGRTISIAEESGLIVPLGNWMLDEICRQCREWAEMGLTQVQVGVNVSPMQLLRFDFARVVEKTLEQYGLNPRMLEFEVTESTMMPDRGTDAPHQIAMLAQLGIRFAVDDFGTGYSSLGRLHQLPVKSLKIDQTFTQRIAEFNGTYPTVEAIVALAHTFGMTVVAEGVENEQQLELLEELGCDRVQGFLFSRPLSGREATEFLRFAERQDVDEAEMMGVILA